ncbi:MAG TPA: CoA-binding protein [Actinomycetota bacterium]|nr:CoA-binding protein [Actinomycetota bacterium]
MTDEELLRMYGSTKTIAVVGASSDPSKVSHTIPVYLQSQGFKIIPINPREEMLFGEKAFASLKDVEGPIDVVDVFRPAEETPDIARQAVEAGAKVLWLQSGIESAEAEAIALEGGLEVVMGACLGTTHGRLGLGPGP